MKRRKFVQSAMLMPALAALPGLAEAHLQLGSNQQIIATPVFVDAPQNKYFDLGLEYFFTYGAQGVFIDLVPSPTNGGHAGVCFNAAPNANGVWQDIRLHQSLNFPVLQVLWFRGVGVIFHADGRIQSEQWIVKPNGDPGATNFVSMGNYTVGSPVRVTATTNISTRQTILAVYSLNSAGNVVALLGGTTLTAEVIGDRAGVFVIGGGQVNARPAAIFP